MAEEGAPLELLVLLELDQLHREEVEDMAGEGAPLELLDPEVA